MASPETDKVLWESLSPDERKSEGLIDPNEMYLREFDIGKIGQAAIDAEVEAYFDGMPYAD